MSSFSIANGWKKGTIYDPATGDRIQFNKLDREITIYEPEVIKQEHTFGSYQAAERVRYGLGGPDFEGFDLAMTWKRTATPLNVVAYNPSGKNLQAYEDVLIDELVENYSPTREDGDSSWGLQFEAVGEALNIHTNVNLLAFAGWQDADANNIPDGYNSSATPVSFIGGTYEGNYSDANATLIAVIFPISGITGTLSGSVAWDDGKMIIRPLDFNSVSLGDISTIIQQPVGQIISAAGKTPSGVYTLNAILFRATGNNLGATLSYPALTTNGELTPGTKFMSW